MVKILATVAVLAPLPWLVESNFWMNFAVLVLFFGYLGQSWNILAGYAGQFSFGHAAFFGTGAYVAAILQLKFGVNPWLGLFLSAVGGGLVGAFIGALSFRYGLRGAYFTLVTLAFAEVLRVLSNSPGLTGGGLGLMVPLNYGIGNLQFADKTGYYYIILAMTAGSLVFAWYLERSRFGARLMAVRENEDAAKALGVNVFRYKLMAIISSGAMAGLGGTFYVQYFYYLDPAIAYGPAKSIEMLLMTIVGGMGTVFGPLVGSLVLHLVGDLTRAVLADAPGLNLVFYGVVLIVILRYLPNGLIGEAKALQRRWRAARQRAAGAE